MLQTKELVKIYRPKKGVPVTALNKVTLTFPEKGMVFLLGKSGSGKSTLLNVLGGLDDYNGGEIIIKGVSSKFFRRKHFDSYRNTYVGFIFQEYHVLEEYTVGANIALAIELQDRHATDEEINEILKAVDLEGFGNRKPNELSGGQKQRVAIARALVKKPEIIMADEPTGALDSNTGRQILETLRKLSKEKLVIVVSHDREFAENYADRIIELADGVVINDVERNVDGEEAEGIAFAGNTVEIPGGYHLTEDDRKAINDYIDKLKTGKINLEIGEVGVSSRNFVPTDSSKIKLQDGSSFKLIKSKLPFKNAFNMGARALNYKKFRLAITILLSCISFAFFGLSDTFSAYTDAKCRANTLYDNGFEYVSVSKSKHLGEGDDSYWKEDGYKLSLANFDEIEKATGVRMHGVYVPNNGKFSFDKNTNPSVKLTDTDYNIYNKRFTGAAEIDKEVLDKLDFEILAGTLPDGDKNEIAVSEYVLEIFKNTYYGDGTYEINAEGKKIYNYYAVKEAKHLIGKILNMNGTEYKITAVVDTGFNVDRYLPLTVSEENITDSKMIKIGSLQKEFEMASQYSFASVMMVGEGFIDRLAGKLPLIAKPIDGEYRINSREFTVHSDYLCRFENIDLKDVHWVDGPRTKLGEKELIVSYDTLEYMGLDAPKTIDGWAERMGTENNYTVWKNFLANADDDDFLADRGYKVVGIIEESNDIFKSVICHDNLYYQFVDEGDNFYTYAVGAMPKTKSGVKKFVDYCYDEDSDIQFWIRNSATWKLDTVSAELSKFAMIFLYIGLGFAAFAALMLANFISTSISYKQEEIGILRAIGSRGVDVFRIFFAESAIIALTNFILSTLIVGITTNVLNNIIRETTLITILSFNLRQVVLLFIVSGVVAFLASYVPVKKVASMKPIDAIRNR